LFWTGPALSAFDLVPRRTRWHLGGEYVEYWSQLINLVLEQLAGIEELKGVVVVAATNHPEKISPAIKRAGRLDHEIVIEKPGTTDLAKIFSHHLGDDLVGADLLPVAAVARGATGADVEAWVRRAKASARRAQRKVSVEDLEHQIRSGKPILTPDARRRISVHEAGHTVVARMLEVKFHSVSIHDLGGETEVAPPDGTTTLDGIERHMAIAMAGRAAEEMVLGDVCVSSGSDANSDLARATAMAKSIELQFGLGSLGLIYVADDLLGGVRQYPGVLESVRRRLAAALDRARATLVAHRAELTSVADALSIRGYLDAPEVDVILAGANQRPSIDRSKVREAAE
jgi:cell division protease FtsH